MFRYEKELAVYTAARDAFLAQQAASSSSSSGAGGSTKKKKKTEK